MPIKEFQLFCKEENLKMTFEWAKSHVKSFIISFMQFYWVGLHRKIPIWPSPGSLLFYCYFVSKIYFLIFLIKQKKNKNWKKKAYFKWTVKLTGNWSLISWWLLCHYETIIIISHILSQKCFFFFFKLIFSLLLIFFFYLPDFFFTFFKLLLNFIDPLLYI